jgi:hypothetical protein
MIIVNESMEVLCGWRRLQAILAIGTFLQIDVVLVKLNPEDEAAFIVFSNSQRTKTALEKFREASVLKLHWAKMPGQRTDLQPQLSDVERKRTRTRIADAIGITETEVHKLETVGEKDIAMLELVGDDVSLNEVYNAVKSDKPKHKEPVKEIDLDTIHPCPFCGNVPRRIEIDENNNLTYKDQ